MSPIGLRVAAFESRRGEEMARLITRHGGTPHVSPSMREVPLEENKQAIDFAHRLITAEIDAVILLTGVGVETLTQVVERHIKRDRFLTALADVDRRRTQSLERLRERHISRRSGGNEQERGQSAHHRAHVLPSPCRVG